MGVHDAVTGLYNRAFFEEEIKRLSENPKLPTCVIMADVNGLKVVNDALGHFAGDILLQEAADALREVCRPQDIIARWGGVSLPYC